MGTRDRGWGNKKMYRKEKTSKMKMNKKGQSCLRTKKRTNETLIYCTIKKPQQSTVYPLAP